MLAAATYVALSHARYLAMFAITVVTLGGTLFEGTITTDTHDVSAPSPARWRIRIPSVVAAALTTALWVMAVVHIADYVSDRSYIYFRADSRFGAGESFWFPERAARFIEQEKLPGMCSQRSLWVDLQLYDCGRDIQTSSMPAPII